MMTAKTLELTHFRSIPSIPRGAHTDLYSVSRGVQVFPSGLKTVATQTENLPTIDFACGTESSPAAKKSSVSQVTDADDTDNVHMSDNEVNRRTNIPPGGTCKHFHLLSLQKTAAKHPIKSNPGTFVTRMRDCESSIFLSGLLDVGDEIIEVDKINVKEKDIDEVDHLIMKKNKVLLKILPRSKRNNN
ncbi:uncharacterized protein LOC143242875 isoform X1 [Tachypleus tridentatus]|uniref:uncharacterized protein LOC143242875 isoform X1 n=1 Tax=Tachypleus tridentatus TaxID=6853 RepID=UPI003FD01904